MNPNKTSVGFETERLELVEDHIKPVVSNKKIVDAFKTVERHLFVPISGQHLSYKDRPLPIGHEQTISQPSLVAQMIEMLDLEPSETVLEVGTGSGYQTALLSLLAKQVYSIERIPELAKQAAIRLRDLGYDNVEVVSGDGSLGLIDYAPYEKIIVSAGSPSRVPKALIDQLAVGGRLVIPAGDRSSQEILLVTKDDQGFKTESKGQVRFVPLIGHHGWN